MKDTITPGQAMLDAMGRDGFRTSMNNAQAEYFAKAAIAAHEAAKWRAPEELPEENKHILIRANAGGLAAKYLARLLRGGKVGSYF